MKKYLSIIIATLILSGCTVIISSEGVNIDRQSELISSQSQ